MSSRVTNMRQASIASLFIAFILTLAFVIAASVSLHTSFSMTQFGLTGYAGDDLIGSANYFTLTTWTECALSNIKRPQDGIKCVELPFDDEDSKAVFSLIPINNPGSTGKAVMALQSIILVLLVWPFVALTKPTLTVPFKRESSLACVAIANILAIVSFSVWYVKCISGIAVTNCTTKGCNRSNPVTLTVTPSTSGAFTFEVIIFIELLCALGSLVMYYYFLSREESTKTEQNAGAIPDGAVPLVAGQTSSEGAYFRV